MTLTLGRRYIGRTLESTAAGLPIVAVQPGGGPGSPSAVVRVHSLALFVRRNWATAGIEIRDNHYYVDPNTGSPIIYWFAYDWGDYETFSGLQEFTIGLFPSENVLGFLDDEFPGNHFETWRLIEPSGAPSNASFVTDPWSLGQVFAPPPPLPFFSIGIPGLPLE